MNIGRLYEILNATTIQLRKGAAIEERETGKLKVTEIFAMPHESEVTDDNIEKIDMFLLVIGVRKKEAKALKDELVSILDTYPQPQRLASGPSYIEIGAVLGDQGAAFQLFALGKVLDLWSVITPASLGMTGALAVKAAGDGYIMMSGYAAPLLKAAASPG